MITEESKIEIQDWRCPVCNRRLALSVGKSILEVETKNGQFIVTDSLSREARCKCGVITTVSGCLTVVTLSYPQLKA